MANQSKDIQTSRRRWLVCVAAGIAVAVIAAGAVWQYARRRPTGPATGDGFDGAEEAVLWLHPVGRATR